jgi:hypothetical protein
MAKVITEDSGDSEPKKLGRIVRLPKIESFQLTDESAGEGSFYGLLKGQDLETIEKVGWQPQAGIPVEAIPTPVAGEGSRQTLKVALPWPAPAPHAPLHIWLRGESKGRATTARY